MPCVLLLAVSGCGGCRANPDDDAQTAQADGKPKPEENDKPKGKPKEKPKADFNPLRLNTVPGDPQDPLRALKPGHWASATVDAKANNFDFNGNLTARANDKEGQPLPVEGTPSYLTFHRPAVLPKAQQKQLEVTLFVPRTVSRPWVQSQLRDDASGMEVKREQEQIQPMPAYQYDLVVLARQPARYRYLTLAECVRPVTDDMNPAEDGFVYRVIAPRLGPRAPLPSQSLFWTSVAYVLWDDAAPESFDHDQEQAFLDWLYWGGHLIVSGPQSLDSLRGSFLAPYLPVASNGPREISAADLQEIASQWSIKSGRPGSDELRVKKPWPGIQWQLQPLGQVVAGTGGLVAERCLGLGRIVVTAFPLSQPELTKWRGFDGFLNAGVMRRPARKFLAGVDGLRRTEWATDGSSCWNPRQATHVRYFTRDTEALSEKPAGAPLAQDPFADPFGPVAALAEEVHEGGSAAWNDFGPVPEAVRKSLREGAGIVVPKPDFVLWILGLYLFVLVPLNWSIFRLLGRVEWAWAMTPVISLSFAGLVIWLAQLDIGFARSSTELTILELQAGYPRGHLSRYTALYASLSTGYRLHYDSPSAVAQPFAANADFTLLRGQARHPVELRRENGVTLSGLEVSSNSTSMVHAEAMWDLGGALTWHEPAEGPPELGNETSLKLSGVGLVRRTLRDNGSTFIEAAWLGDLSPSAVVQPRFKAVALLRQPKPASENAGLDSAALPHTPGENNAEQVELSQLSYVRPLSSPSGSEGLNLAELVQLAEAPANLEPGEVRLVGWCLADVPGLDIQPLSLRRRHATLVVAHLARKNAHAPQPDVWLTSDTLPLGRLPMLDADQAPAAQAPAAQLPADPAPPTQPPVDPAQPTQPPVDPTKPPAGNTPAAPPTP